MKRLAVAVLAVATVLLGACATNQQTQDRLTLAMNVMTTYVVHSTALVSSGALPKDPAQSRLKSAKEASKALTGALQLISTCEGQKGECDLRQVVQSIGETALDRLEEHFLRTGEFKEAEALAAARIVYALMMNSANPAQEGGGGVYSTVFGPLVARFNAAVDGLDAAVAKLN